MKWHATFIGLLIFIVLFFASCGGTTPVSGPTNPLFPVTVDEWRSELTRSNTTFGQCDGYWCYVPGGTYTIGGWLDDPWDDNDTKVDVALKDYWIAKYPVTVQQYRQFVDAGGYNSEAYWTPKGWAWKQEEHITQPNTWNDSRFTSNNQPLTGVSWYEATAFITWLNAQLKDDLDGGYQVSLPTEVEWEVAAIYGRQKHRRIYPWGNKEPDATRADFDQDLWTGQPLPVGQHPAGAAACGAQNMVGSVWEWTSSLWHDNPAQSNNGQEDLRTNDVDVMVLRGGSWSYPPVLPTDDDLGPPDYYSADFGFRLARRLP